MQIGFEVSSVRRQLSGVGHYASSLLEALQYEFPDRQLLVLSHLAAYSPPGSSLIATQRRSFPVKEVWMQFWLPRVIARYKPDVCHFTNSIAPLRTNVPYAITVHDLSLIKHPEWHPRSRRAWMRRIMRPSILHASAVICDSEKTRKDLLEWIRLDPSKIRVVPLAARDKFFVIRTERDKEGLRAKYGLTRPFLLYVGNIEPRKNLRRLVQAFRRLDPAGIDLVLAGRRAWLHEGILREVQDAANRERIHLIDYVEESTLPALYQSALAFVYPSLMEGFGLPVLEAMASGTPVIVSDVEPLSSLVGNAGWLARPESLESWEAAIAEAVHDRQKRSAFAAEARIKATQYSWKRAAAATMKCYEDILQCSRN